MKAIKIIGFISLFYLSHVNADIKIALTFDDGPVGATEESESPTKMVLDTLRQENITAAFFILTESDQFLWNTLPKGETSEGLALIKKELREGHLVACHWGGSYESQSNLHPNRLKYPAYDYNNDGIINKATLIGNALETDLLQCISRLNQATNEAHITDNPIDFVRPPYWEFKNEEGDARTTYAAMNLKMILTDAKLDDGGMGFQRSKVMVKDMRRAINAGEDNIILTMHDPMRSTARNLKNIIRTIRQTMTKQSLTEGKDWSFVKSRAEMQTLFNAKKYFYLSDYTTPTRVKQMI